VNTAPQTRVVLVTGASSGIGLCSAALFASRGWRVGLVSRSSDGLVAAASLIGRQTPGALVAYAAADVTDSAALAAAARSIAATLGPIGVWVNAAGNGVYGHFSDVSEAEFRRVTDVTYLGTVNGTRVALAHMTPRNEGTIVNVCSAVVFHGVPLMTSYSGAKAAVRAFGQSLGMELRLAGSRVRIGTLFPPAINTPFFDHAVSHMGFPARPVPPVYRTDVAAQGVYLCATGRGGEMLVTGVVVAYSWITRMSPKLAGFLVSKSDFASEMPRDDGVREQVPCLFDSKNTGFSMHGPFRRRARGWSSQLGLTGLLRRLLPVRPVRPVVRSQPSPAHAEPDPAPAGSASPRHAASDSIR
jgi:short-subunit dehydrogenase